jgi:hypothetical protein
MHDIVSASGLCSNQCTGVDMHARWVPTTHPTPGCWAKGWEPGQQYPCVESQQTETSVQCRRWFQLSQHITSVLGCEVCLSPGVALSMQHS